MNIVSSREYPPLIAYLQTVYRKKETGEYWLLQNKVDLQWAYSSFEDFAADFRDQAAYPRRQGHKLETRSWLPTGFVESDKNAGSMWGEKPEIGLWRKGESTCHAVSLFYADLDNHHDDQPYVTFDDLAELLAGFGLKHILYTSFSHTDTKHKVRIVVPTDRDMTYDEAFKVYQWFSSLLFFQLDGSIYDDGDHVYGPTFGGRYFDCLAGGSLAVDAVIALADGLADDVKARMVRHTPTTRAIIELTPEQRANILAQMADDRAATDNVTITNPKYFKPEWLDEMRTHYVGGSRRQTAFGLLVKAWLYSGGALSFGDMACLQNDIDSEYGLYLSSKYGSTALKEDIYGAMSHAAEPRKELTREEKLKRAFENKKSKYNKG